MTNARAIESTLYTSLDELRARSFSDFLLEDNFDMLDETGQEYLDSIIKASCNMRALIDNLLTLSRVGRIDTEYSKVDMSELLEEVREELKSQIEMKQTIVSGGNLPEIVTQRTWIKQVLMNLIGNGVKFNENNPSRVEVTCTNTSQGFQFSARSVPIGVERVSSRTLRTTQSL